MAIHFLTFGDSIKYGQALYRCEEQAKNFRYKNGNPVFSSVYCVDDNDLKNNFTAFWSAHHNFIVNNVRGYGYWIWKSYLISELLNNIPEDDIVFYMDSGCQLNYDGIERFKFYYDMAMKHGGLAFKLTHLDISWCKSDTYLRILNKIDDNLNSFQYVGGINFFKNNKESRNLVKEWFEICKEDNYRYLDDSPSMIPNHSSFVEHRHDQSIFSLLVKKYNYFFTLDDETWWREKDWQIISKKYPIWATRNSDKILKTGA